MCVHARSWQVGHLIGEAGRLETQEEWQFKFQGHLLGNQEEPMLWRKPQGRPLGKSVLFWEAGLLFHSGLEWSHEALSHHGGQSALPEVYRLTC